MARENIFGGTVWGGRGERIGMEPIADVVAETAVPPERSREMLDARELPPPQPLRNTLERLAELDPETVLVQVNDRAPLHLYPKLEDRGYVYETVTAEEAVVTVIWRK